MSGYALKIVAICPESLLDWTFVGFFGSQTGVFISNLRNQAVNAESGWFGDKFSDVRKKDYLEIIDLLERRQALINYQPTSSPKPPEGSSSYNLVLKEFRNSENRTIEFAICDHEQASQQSKSNFFTKRRAIIEDKFIPKHISVEMKKGALTSALTQHFFKCHKFKIIDPYIFDIKQKEIL